MEPKRFVKRTIGPPIGKELNAGTLKPSPEVCFSWMKMFFGNVRIGAFESNVVLSSLERFTTSLFEVVNRR